MTIRACIQDTARLLHHILPCSLFLYFDLIACYVITTQTIVLICTLIVYSIITFHVWTLIGDYESPIHWIIYRNNLINDMQHIIRTSIYVLVILSLYRYYSQCQVILHWSHSCMLSFGFYLQLSVFLGSILW